MYRIAVCEDEPNLREGLCAQCREIMSGLDVEYEIVPFTSAEALEAALTDGERFDLLCLDILLTGKTGMELALELRKRDERTDVLFVTGFVEYALEGYKTNAVRYLLKPVKRPELEEALLTCLRRKDQPKTVTLRGGGKVTALSLEDIRYVESRNHDCVFHMIQGERSFSIPLIQVEQLLPKEQFCRCHNSYLVNLAQVKEVSGRTALLSAGGHLPIGRRYADQFQGKFIAYLNLNSR